MARPSARRARSPGFAFAAVLVAGLSTAGGCAPGKGAGAGGGMPTAALDHAIGDVIGDPDTCVVLADRATGKVVYRYGQPFNCERGVQACDRPGAISASQALAFAGQPGGREVSCPSNADGSRTAGWAAGRFASARHDLVYSALMEGETALPGHEIAARLEGAFRRAGL
jgi:hypothetical protein